MAAIAYRSATLDDLETLGALRWEMQAEMHAVTEDRAEYIATYAREMRGELEQGRAHAWLAEVDGEPVASVTLLWWVVPPNILVPRRRRGQVSNVFTRPAYRRLGISRELMGMLIAQAREMGVQRLVLWPSEMGEPLYAGLGFEPSPAMELNL